MIVAATALFVVGVLMLVGAAHNLTAAVRAQALAVHRAAAATEASIAVAKAQIELNRQLVETAKARAFGGYDVSTHAARH